MFHKQESFSAAERFHTRRDYNAVMVRQQKAVGKYLIVLLSPRTGSSEESSSCARLGILVSKKINKRAVRRHQLKRWVREVFRRELKGQLAGYDVVVLFRRDPPDNDGTYARIRNECVKCSSEALLAKAQWNKGRQKKSTKNPKAL